MANVIVRCQVKSKNLSDFYGVDVFMLCILQAAQS